MRTSPPRAQPGAARAPDLRHAALVAALRGGGAVLGLGFWVLLGRMLGAEGSGRLRQGLALVMFSAAFLRFGLDSIVLREVSVCVQRGRGARRLMRRVFGLILVAGVPLAALLCLAARPLANGWFDDAGLAPVLAVIVWASIPMAILAVAGEAHKGAGRPGWGTFLQFEARHLLFLPIAFLWIGFVPDGDAASATVRAAWVLLGSFAVAAALSVVGWLARPSSDVATPGLSLRAALRHGRPLLQCALLLMSLEWLDTLLLGAFADSRSVGVYGVAVSAAMVMSFLLYGANVVLAPRFARAFADHDPARVQHEARAMTRRLLVIGVPLACLCALFAETLLSAFGPEFGAEGPAPFRILLIGQVVSLGTGPVGYILLMGKRELTYRNNTAIAAVAHLVLLGVLLPMFGTLGASIATATALALASLLHLRSCRRELGLATIGPLAVPLPEAAR